MDFYTFNLLEGLSWIGLAFIIVFYEYNGLPKQYRFMASFTVVTLIVFGLSDFVENFVGGFWHANEWLLIGKAICVMALAYAVFWYVRMRLHEDRELEKKVGAISRD